MGLRKIQNVFRAFFSRADPDGMDAIQQKSRVGKWSSQEFVVPSFQLRFEALEIVAISDRRCVANLSV
jgi:hypothetical protein